MVAHAQLSTHERGETRTRAKMSFVHTASVAAEFKRVRASNLRELSPTVDSFLQEHENNKGPINKDNSSKCEKFDTKFSQKDPAAIAFLALSLLMFPIIGSVIFRTKDTECQCF